MLKSKLMKILTGILTAVTVFTATMPAVLAADVAEPEVAVETAATDPNAEFLAELLRLTNVERVKAGVAELQLYADLQTAATIRAAEASESFSHTRPNGTRWTTAFTETGVSYGFAGENLARGFSKAETIVSAWMNSETHRANLLDADFTHVAFGINVDANGKIAVSQLFITPKA